MLVFEKCDCVIRECVKKKKLEMLSAEYSPI